MEEELTVCEEGEIEDNGSGEEPPHSEQVKPVMVNDAETPTGKNCCGAGKVLQCSKSSWVGELHDGPFVNDG